MKFLDIAEISRRSGLPPSALRHYEQIGLIKSVGRHGLRRQFGPQVLQQLSLIALGKTAGFSLEEIARMFRDDGKLGLPRAELRAKADELDRQIRKLAALRNVIHHVAACPAPSHLECPKFQRLMQAARWSDSNGGIRSRQRATVPNTPKRSAR